MSKWSQQRKCVSHLNPIITYYIIITTNSSLDGTQYCFTYLIYSEHLPYLAQSFCDLWVYACLLITNTGQALQGIRYAKHTQHHIYLTCTLPLFIFFFNISQVLFVSGRYQACHWYCCNQNNIYLLSILSIISAVRDTNSHCSKLSSQCKMGLLTGGYGV